VKDPVVKGIVGSKMSRLGLVLALCLVTIASSVPSGVVDGSIRGVVVGLNQSCQAIYADTCYSNEECITHLNRYWVLPNTTYVTYIDFEYDRSAFCGSTNGTGFHPASGSGLGMYVEISGLAWQDGLCMTMTRPVVCEWYQPCFPQFCVLEGFGGVLIPNIKPVAYW
jgi:hypothetical protein